MGISANNVYEHICISTNNVYIYVELRTGIYIFYMQCTLLPNYS